MTCSREVKTTRPSAQASWWQEHGAAHAGGPRAQQGGKLETRALFAGSQGGTVARAGGNTCGPLSARLDLRPPRSCGRIRTGSATTNSTLSSLPPETLWTLLTRRGIAPAGRMYE